MLRYLSGKLMKGNLSGNGFIDVTVDLLSETSKYLQSIPELSPTALDYSMKYQLLQCIESLLKYLSSIESIEIEYFPTSPGNKDDVCVNSEKKPLAKSKSVDYKRIKQPLPDEEIAKQSEPQSNVGRSKFKLFKKKVKFSGNNTKLLPSGSKNNEREYINSPMLQERDITKSLVNTFRRYRSTENLLESFPQASSGFQVKDFGETCDVHTYELPSMTRSRLSYSDSDNDLEGYLKLNKLVDQVMPSNDTDEQVAKIRLKVNATELGERVCVLTDSILLIGKELDGSVAEYTCMLTQYCLNQQMSDESNFSICISHNDVNMFLTFKSEDIYTKWIEDIKRNMLKVRYLSINFSNQLTDSGYECIKQPIYERISLLSEDPMDICEGEKSINSDK